MVVPRGVGVSEKEPRTNGETDANCLAAGNEGQERTITWWFMSKARGYNECDKESLSAGRQGVGLWATGRRLGPGTRIPTRY